MTGLKGPLAPVTSRELPPPIQPVQTPGTSLLHTSQKSSLPQEGKSGQGILPSRAVHACLCLCMRARVYVSTHMVPGVLQVQWLRLTHLEWVCLTINHHQSSLALSSCTRQPQVSLV